MRDEGPVQPTALGAACAIFDGEGRVLLVHHTYGRLNWELPGGGAEPGEAPDETARRELLEETGLPAELDRLTGVYYEPDHDFGPMLHFVFRCRWHDRLDPVAASLEVSEARYWSLDEPPHAHLRFYRASHPGRCPWRPGLRRARRQPSVARVIEAITPSLTVTGETSLSA